MLKKLPNLILCIQIILAIPLVLIEKPNTIFLLLYVVSGILALFQTCTSLFDRKKLTPDASGAMVFLFVILYKLFFQLSIKIPHVVMMLSTGVIILKAIAFLLTRWKFHIWSSMHTIGNTITGILLFLYIPYCIFQGRMDFILSITLIVFIYLFTFEEILLILSSSTYDSSTKSIFTK